MAWRRTVVGLVRELSVRALFVLVGAACAALGCGPPPPTPMSSGDGSSKPGARSSAVYGNVDGEYVKWRLNLLAAWRGSVFAVDDRLRVVVEAAFPKEEEAKAFENLCTSLLSGVRAQLSTSDIKAEDAEAVAHTLNGFSVERDGSRLVARFDVGESPAQQARDIQLAATIVLPFVRKLTNRAR